MGIKTLEQKMTQNKIGAMWLNEPLKNPETEIKYTKENQK